MHISIYPRSFQVRFRNKTRFTILYVYVWITFFLEEDQISNRIHEQIKGKTNKCKRMFYHHRVRINHCLPLMEAAQGAKGTTEVTSLTIFFFFFWLHCTTCGILVSQPRIEPVPWAVKVQSPSPWTTREFPTKNLKHFISGTSSVMSDSLWPHRL